MSPADLHRARLLTDIVTGGFGIHSALRAVQVIQARIVHAGFKTRLPSALKHFNCYFKMTKYDINEYINVYIRNT